LLLPVRLVVPELVTSGDGVLEVKHIEETQRMIGSAATRSESMRTSLDHVPVNEEEADVVRRYSFKQNGDLLNGWVNGELVDPETRLEGFEEFIKQLKTARFGPGSSGE